MSATAELMEIGQAPECVHTDAREKKYYLMKRFVRAAIKEAENNADMGVTVVAFLYETPYNFLVMVNGDAHFDKVAKIFCTPEFTNDERREILMNMKIVDKPTMEFEAADRGYKLPTYPVFAVVTF